MTGTGTFLSLFFKARTGPKTASPRFLHRGKCLRSQSNSMTNVPTFSTWRSYEKAVERLNDFANDTDADLTAYVQMYRTRIADMTPGTLTSTRDRVAFWIQLVVVFARASLLECL